MMILRTPDKEFDNLPDYPFEPHYVEVEDGIKMHYVDKGRADSVTVLMLHGEPTWSFLYRKIIMKVAEAGFRAVAPDLIGFGKSDKPAERKAYTYRNHLRWVRNFIEKVNIKGCVLVCHDWGGLIGLRLAGEEPELFRSIVACNTFLPTGDMPPSEAFLRWRKFVEKVEEFDIGRAVQNGCVKPLSEDVLRAYTAPFPSEEFKAGARTFPLLVPISPDDPESEPNRKAWQTLSKWEKPFITAFSDSDPITRGGDRFFQMVVPGAKDQPHRVIKNAGHFVQEDNPEELAGVILEHLHMENEKEG